MASSLKLGSKVRQLRRQSRITQVQLAQKLGISASYLNLIEHDQRPLTAELLVKVAQEFQVDLASFAPRQDERLSAQLLEVFADPQLDGQQLTAVDVREFAETYSGVARTVLVLYQALQDARALNDSLVSKIYDGQAQPGVHALQLPSEEVGEFIQAKMNYFALLEESAEQLWRDGRLEQDDVTRGLVRWLQERHGVSVEIVRHGKGPPAVRQFDPMRFVVQLAEGLPPRSRRFQLAVQIALLSYGDVLDQLVDDRLLTTDEARKLARLVLANYFAGAVLMPYAPFLEAAESVRYDLEVLGHRFGVSFEQVCHRVTTLRRQGAEGVPFHMVRVDLAGNLSKHFSASGIRFARFSGACPRWNIHSAFLTPGLIRTQTSQMPGGETYFCLARTVPKGGGGFHSPHTMQAIGLGCRTDYAERLVYSDGIDLKNEAAIVPVGVTCRLCERTDCSQRAFPSLQYPLQVDPNVRGPSLLGPRRH
jgi:predicted transcriptional regulator/DNA-binding XRE family transcriptional regulator